MVWSFTTMLKSKARLAAGKRKTRPAAQFNCKAMAIRCSTETFGFCRGDKHRRCFKEKAATSRRCVVPVVETRGTLSRNPLDCSRSETLVIRRERVQTIFNPNKKEYESTHVCENCGAGERAGNRKPHLGSTHFFT